MKKKVNVMVAKKHACTQNTMKNDDTA